MIKYVVRDGGYNPDEIETPEFNTNLSDLTPCNRFITSLFDKERFLYMLRYGIMFLTEIKKVRNATTNVEEEIPIKQKHIMRYPQFFATRAIIKRFSEEDKNGIIWHTQGSGKTALSAYSLKVITDFFDKKNVNTRFFFIVDRLDLQNIEDKGKKDLLNLFFDGLYTKNDNWKYEDEIRSITLVNETEDKDARKISINNISAIYLGSKMTESTQKSLLKLISGDAYFDKLKIFKMKNDISEYKATPSRLK